MNIDLIEIMDAPAGEKCYLRGTPIIVELVKFEQRMSGEGSVFYKHEGSDEIIEDSVLDKNYEPTVCPIYLSGATLIKRNLDRLPVGTLVPSLSVINNHMPSYSICHNIDIAGEIPVSVRRNKKFLESPFIIMSDPFVDVWSMYRVASKGLFFEAWFLSIDEKYTIRFWPQIVDILAEECKRADDEFRKLVG